VLAERELLAILHLQHQAALPQPAQAVDRDVGDAFGLGGDGQPLDGLVEAQHAAGAGRRHRHRRDVDVGARRRVAGPHRRLHARAAVGEPLHHRHRAGDGRVLAVILHDRLVVEVDQRHLVDLADLRERLRRGVDVDVDRVVARFTPRIRALDLAAQHELARDARDDRHPRHGAQVGDHGRRGIAQTDDEVQPFAAA
jgi:hypothetical protein